MRHFLRPLIVHSLMSIAALGCSRTDTPTTPAGGATSVSPSTAAAVAPSVTKEQLWELYSTKKDAAFFAGMQQFGTGSIPVLREGLRDADGLHRHAFAEMLLWWGQGGIDALVDALSDAHPDARSAAAFALVEGINQSVFPQFATDPKTQKQVEVKDWAKVASVLLEVARDKTRENDADRAAKDLPAAFMDRSKFKQVLPVLKPGLTDDDARIRMHTSLAFQSYVNGYLAPVVNPPTRATPLAPWETYDPNDVKAAIEALTAVANGADASKTQEAVKALTQVESLLQKAREKDPILLK